MTDHDLKLATLLSMTHACTLRMSKLRREQPSAWRTKYNHLARLRAEADALLITKDNYPRAVNCVSEFAAALNGGPH